MSCAQLTAAAASTTVPGDSSAESPALGSGYSSPPLRLPSSGSASAGGDGASYGPFQFDDKNPTGFMHDLLLSDTTASGIHDVTDRGVSLDDSQIFGGAGDIASSIAADGGPSSHVDPGGLNGGGDGTTPGHQRESVPEPSAMLMLGTGIASLLARRARQV
jgi:hypothetical protein